MRERQKEKNAEAVVLVFFKNNICLKKLTKFLRPIKNSGQF